jgi:hypothetical protein
LSPTGGLAAGHDAPGAVREHAGRSRPGGRPRLLAHRRGGGSAAISASSGRHHRGQPRPVRGHGRPLAPVGFDATQRMGTPPRRPTRTSGSPPAAPHGQARDLRVGAQEEKERGLGGVPARALLGIGRRRRRRGPRHEGRAGEELEVGPRTGQDALQRACPRLRAQPEQAAAFVRGRAARGGDAPQAGGVDGGDGQDGDRAEQSSPTGQHDGTIARRWRRRKAPGRASGCAARARGVL